MPHWLLRTLLPRAERREVLADLSAEFVQHAAAHGHASARRWIWRQALASAPSLLGWTWWRGWSGYQPKANAYRPGGPMIKYVLADVRYAARRLFARPAYSLLAIVTLALGIGGTAAVFGIARPLIFDPLPYANADEVTSFWFGGSWTEQEYLHLRDKFPGYRAVAAHRPAAFTLRRGDAPAQLVSGRWVSHELFDVLGANH